MQFLSRLNIGARLGVAFALLLTMLVAISVLSVVSLGKVNDATADMNDNWLLATRELGNTQDAINMLRRVEANIVMASDVKKHEAELARWREARTEVTRAWKAYEATVTTDEERKLADAVKGAFKSLLDGQEKLFAMPRGTAESDNEARRLFQDFTRPAMNATIAAIEKLGDFQQAGANRTFAQSQAEYAATRMLVIGLSLAALALGVVLAWAITRSISRPVARAVEVAGTVANGDLTSTIVVHSNDETGKLLAALKRMNEKLAAIVGKVRNSSDSIATGSTQIASGNLDLSQRTEEQASNLQQTAASMEQLTATVAQNAETAKQASQLASSASSSAARGGEVVAQVVATMGAITESSRRINDIIGVIDGIAFQTNILALNASVEAARAGEQGRGFAVVAGEVRGLAQRSAGAAKEIKNLIGQSVTSVEAGAKQVDEAGKAMAEIVSQVKRVNDLMGEINAASAEQSSGIGQIGDAVSQLDQVTQQNAALVEESAAAAESLRHQAAQLAEVVAQFKVDPRLSAPMLPPAASATPKVKPQPVGRASARTAKATETAPARAAEPAAAGGDWETY